MRLLKELDDAASKAKAAMNKTEADYRKAINPQWLYFDSKLIPYAQLSRVNERDIFFVTNCRRGAALLRRLDQLPASNWQRAVLNIPKRKHKQIRFVDETISLRGRFPSRWTSTC